MTHHQPNALAPEAATVVRSDESRPTVAAVIVNHNGGRCVLNAVDALQKQTYRVAPIVVVDNGSIDASPAAIRERFETVTVIALGENRGLPAARNVGIGAVSTNLVLSLDDDVYPQPNCVERMIEALLEEGAALVCPRIRLLPQCDVVQADGAHIHFLGTLAMRHAYAPLKGLPTDRVLVGGCIGACMLFDRDKLVAAGCFDELFFFYFEDMEISLRMRSLGHRIVCEPAAEVLHDRGEGTPGLSYRGRGNYPLRRAYLTIRHRWLAILIHYRWRSLYYHRS